MLSSPAWDLRWRYSPTIRGVATRSPLAPASTIGVMNTLPSAILFKCSHWFDLSSRVVLIGGRSDRYWLEMALKLQARTILPRPVKVSLVLDTIWRTLNVRTDGFDGPTRINRD